MVAAIGAVAAVGSAAISSSGAKSAANAQSASAEQASMLQAQAQAQMRQDLAPWVKAGGNAQDLLGRYLGTGGVGSTGVTSMGLATGLSPDQVRAQLLSRFTKAGAPGANAPIRSGQGLIDTYGAQGAYDRINSGANALFGENRRFQTVGGPGDTNAIGDIYGSSNYAAGNGSGDSIDEAGLNAEIAKYYAEQKAQEDALKSDPTYGSLLRPYRNGEEFKFTGEDLLKDPGYKFGLDQGTQGIERGQASRGSFLSGGAMKELARYNEDYAGTKFNEGFGRAQSTWNTNLGAYNNNRNTIYSFLTGQSQMGQNSAAQVGAAGNQTAASMGNNITGAGNTAAAAQVASSNALAGGVNSIANAYRENNPSTAAGWNTLLSNNGGGYSGYTGYVGGKDPIADKNTSMGWT